MLGQISDSTKIEILGFQCLRNLLIQKGWSKGENLWIIFLFLEIILLIWLALVIVTLVISTELLFTVNSSAKGKIDLTSPTLTAFIHINFPVGLFVDEEPIFSFVPAIGISEIIKLPNNFSKLWQDNFLLASLNGKYLYRIKFDDDYNKIIYYEPIYIGDRIRDLIYNKDSKKILLALELESALGIITNKN